MGITAAGSCQAPVKINNFALKEGGRGNTEPHVLRDSE